MYGLSDERTAEIAKTRTVGAARKWLEGVTSTRSIAKVDKHNEWLPADNGGLRRALLEYFGKPKSFAEQTKELFEIRQKRGERVDLWLVRVDTAVWDMFTHSVDETNQLDIAIVKKIARSFTRMYFTQGLRTPIKQFVDLANPKTIEEAREAAKTFEASPDGQRELNSGGAGGQTSGRGVAATSANSKKSDLDCHYCGIKGHVKADCFRRKADVANGKIYDRHPDYPLTSSKDKKKDKKKGKKGKKNNKGKK